MKHRIIMWLCSLFCLCGAIHAQSIVVQGQVTDNTGLPLIMVNIIEEGTTNGTVTDMDGNYTLTVTEGATIEFSFIGYASLKK